MRAGFESLSMPKHPHAHGSLQTTQAENHHTKDASRTSSTALSHYITVQWGILHLLVLENEMIGKKGDDTLPSYKDKISTP